MSEIERFGPFEFDRSRPELRKHGLRVRVPTQSLRILGALLSCPGETLSREAIQKLLWPDGVVVGFDQSINAAITRLRTALGDSADTARFVERVPRQGYRFIASVEKVPREHAAALPEVEPAVFRRPWFRSSVFVSGAAALATLLLVAGIWLRYRLPAPVTRDLIVVADFQNKTGDPIFNGALKQALISHLSQSRRVAILPESRIRTALEQMRGSAEEPVTGEKAREVCQRAGGKAVLAGSVWMLGHRYFVGLDAVACDGGEPLASENAAAESQDRVLAALGDAAQRIRGRLGESLASVRAMPAPAEATTTSLQALKEYSLALNSKAKGDDVIALLEHAIELDPEFASAWYTLSQVHFNRGDEAACERAARRAYALRERASERERLLIENQYHAQVTGDQAEAAKVGLLAAQLYPYDGTARRSAFLPYCKLAEMEKALKLARREVDLAPDDGVSYFNVAIVLLARSQPREAIDVLDQAARRGLDFPLYPYARYLGALLTGDPAAVAREEDLVRKRPFDTRSVVLMSQTLAARGELAAARGVAPAPESPSAKGNAGAILASVAVAEGLYGDHEQAIRDARRALSFDTGRRTMANAAMAFALAGAHPDAQALLDTLVSTYPGDFLIQNSWAPSIRAAISAATGAFERALEQAGKAAKTGGPGFPELMRGVANLRLDRTKDARTEFERVLSARGALLTASAFYGVVTAYPLAQAGVARALALEGRVEESRKAYDAFLTAWTHADPGIPLLAEVRRERELLSAPR